ncbi:MAG: hypothetical protein ACXWZP_05205 [Gaiellaceae bacterium]
MSTFSYTAAKDDAVRISWNGRVVTTLRGDRARRFLDEVEQGGDEQLAMAKATGNFKRGNER